MSSLFSRATLFALCISCVGIPWWGAQADSAALLAKGWFDKGGAGYRLNTLEGDQQAVNAYDRAGKMGNADAARQLYLIYIGGRHISKDEKKAYDWLHKAAALGHIVSAHDLGHRYQLGRAMTKDVGRAVKYFRQAALAGHAESKRDLGVSYYRGEGVVKDEKEALRWMLEAGGEGVALAQYRLGIWFKNGIDGKKNLEEAHKWFAKAIPVFRVEASKGNKQSAMNYAYMHDLGYGVDEDNQVAFDVYSKLAKLDHSGAQYQLATMYLLGDGIEKDVEAGKKWLKRAHDLGYGSATGILKRNGWL